MGEDSEDKKIVKKTRILVLDDDQLLLDTIANLLKKMNIESDLISSAGSAIKKFDQSQNSSDRYDAVIMDLTLPGEINVQEIIDRFRTIDKKAKIIIISGYTDDPMMENYRDYGLAGRIEKPFRIEDLRNALEEAGLKD